MGVVTARWTASGHAVLHGQSTRGMLVGMLCAQEIVKAPAQCPAHVAFQVESHMRDKNAD